MSSSVYAALGQPGGFSPDQRFSEPAPAPQEAPVVQADPVEDAYRRGYDDGAEACRDALETEFAEREAAQGRIEQALARLDEDSFAALRETLRQTVLSLCESAVLPLALDMDGLAARIDIALAMLVRAQDDRVVLLHPDDLALLDSRLPEGTHFRADLSVDRGGLRIETSDGGIEDGPSQWRRILAEALGEC